MVGMMNNTFERMYCYEKVFVLLPIEEREYDREGRGEERRENMM